LQALTEIKSDSFRQYLYAEDVQALIYPTSLSLLQRGQGNGLLLWADRLRTAAQVTIYRLFPQPEAALLSGILIGDDHDLPSDVQEAFQNSGTSHIIAISGFNMAIVAGLVTLLVGSLLPRRQGFGIIVFAVAFYTLLTGATPSVLRAAVMSVVGLLGALIGRRQMGINSLAFTAALMCLVNPFLPWNVSFQLSFAATLGLVWYAAPLEEAVFGFARRLIPAAWVQQLLGWIAEFFFCTLAAQITTLPVMIYHFQRLSLGALLANVLVLPPQSALMILGGAATLAGLLLPALGQVLAYPAWVLLAYTIRLVSLLGALPGEVLFVETIPLWAVALIYLGLFFCSPDGGSMLGMFKDLLKPALLLVGLWLLAAVLARYALSLPDGKMNITMLGGSTQPTLLVRTPGGDTLLLNGATQSADLSSAVARRLSPFERYLGIWLLSDSGEAVLQEFSLLNQRFVPRQVYLADDLPKTAAWRRMANTLAQQGVLYNSLENNQQLTLGEGAFLQVVAEKQGQMTLLLTWHKLCLLIPGGLEVENNPRWKGCWLVLAENDLNGDKTLQSWKALGAQAVLVSGAKETLPASWLDTTRRGWIEIKSDGEQVWIKSER
jgi:competence protein ComEC